ncbi:hypothetical protein [Streptomyces sp. NPDC050546]|uniref:hypothetical protein n=1 Tax=Streptomyces sp. NPDC050546 TaxID=3365628 RepID=UPI0037A8EE38
MPKKTPQDWESLEQELYSAGVDPGEVKAGSRRLLAEARMTGHGCCTRARTPNSGSHTKRHQ